MKIQDWRSFLNEIANKLMAYEEIMALPDCNTCKKKDCYYRPSAGQMVRFNCFDYEGSRDD